VTAPLRASRTMRARGETRCPLCRGTIRRLQPIGLVHGKGWCHTDCINQHNREGRPDQAPSTTTGRLAR
jgi:hypothetical protein